MNSLGQLDQHLLEQLLARAEPAVERRPRGRQLRGEDPHLYTGFLEERAVARSRAS